MKLIYPSEFKLKENKVITNKDYIMFETDYIDYNYNTANNMVKITCFASCSMCDSKHHYHYYYGEYTGPGEKGYKN